jgi:hypothetical protein
MKDLTKIMLNYREPYWGKKKEGGGFCSSLALGKGITLENFFIKNLIFKLKIII